MEAATESRGTIRLWAASAGLQAGLLGVCWMLLWLGVSDVWQRRSFWTAENLMASAFYGDAAIRSGFAGRTLSGLALYFLIYSLLGALLGFALSDRVSRLRVFLVSLLFALTWYYFSFRLLWKSVLPLVALLHSVQTTSVGRLIYGAVLGRYPVYLPQKPASQAMEAAAGIGGEPAEASPVEASPTQEETEAHKPQG